MILVTSLHLGTAPGDWWYWIKKKKITAILRYASHAVQQTLLKYTDGLFLVYSQSYTTATTIHL